jgi:arabinan endo-1,5-alpha-L-arabinosidase
MKRTALCLICLVLLTGCISNRQGGQPEMVDVARITHDEASVRVVDQGFGTTAHDPTIIKDPQSGQYYLFTTGQGIPVHVSEDLKNWKSIGPAISPTPDWVLKAVPKVTDLWAPDVRFYNGRYYLLYSASSFGKNTSAIGLASNKTLDPQSPDFAWVDEGAVVTSAPGDNFNAIDPDLTFDEKGQPWLVFGSFWGGIMLRPLESQTLKPASGNDEIYNIANRRLPPNSIEGAYLLRIGEYFYLFISHDFCCRGVDSTYKIKVGRSKIITGPYLDREGVDLAHNGGTLVLESSERWKGPGHNSILVDGEDYYLVYHAYDAMAAGMPRLHVEALFFDADGWPVAPSAILNGQVK